MVALDPSARAIALLYRRAGFGATPDELAAGVERGYAATVDLLLAGLGSAPDASGASLAAPPFAPRSTVAHLDPAARKAQRVVCRRETPGAQDWWMNRMIVTDTPLREKITLLWSGHFATGISKVVDPELMYNQNQLFRAAGGGPFDQLTQSVARDPAMMIWLDTDTDDARHPNENFGRELMEIFTIGLGNYTQADVTAAAAAFTGYSLDPLTRTFRYRPHRHAPGTVTFLGHTGDLSGEDVIDILVHEPASARFIVASTWSHLAYPVAVADPVVIDLLGAYSPDRPFASLLRAVFLHPAFMSSTTAGGLIKQPLEYIAGAARSLRLGANLERLDPTTGLPATPASTPASPPASTRKAHRLVSFAAEMGQTMYDPPSVGGWAQNAYWLNTATSLARWRAAQVMAAAADLSPLEDMGPPQRLAAVAQTLGIDGFGTTSTAALTAVVGEPRHLMTLALNTPEYVLA
jgi:uncharacterized protein (DUF1800 family)